MDSGDESKGSGSEDEPLVPDTIDDEFYDNLLSKIPELTKLVRQKLGQDHCDNLQRILLCSNHFKSNLHLEELRCHELTENVAQLNAALEENEKEKRLDKGTIEKLRSVIETAWKHKDAAHNREQNAKEQVDRLTKQIESMDSIVKKSGDRRTGLDDKQLDEVKLREKLLNEIKELNKKVVIQRKYTSEVETKRQELEIKNKELLQLMEDSTTESFYFKKRIEALTHELILVKSEIQKYLDENVHLKTQIEQLTKTRIQQNLQILTVRTNYERLQTQHNVSLIKLAKYITDLEYTTEDYNKSKSDLNQKINLLKIREEDLLKLRQEYGKVIKSQDAVARKYGNLIKIKNRFVEDNTRLSNQLMSQEKQLKSMRKAVNRLEKYNENLIKERDILKRDIILEQQNVEKIDKMFHESQNEIRVLKDALDMIELKKKKKESELGKMTQDKERKLEEIQHCSEKIDALQNELHLQHNLEQELRKTIAENHTKLNQMQVQFETVRKENSEMLKRLQHAEEERNQIKNHLDESKDEITKLKTKLTDKDSEISKLQLQIDRMEKERRMMKNEFRNTQLGHQHTKSELLEKRMDNDRLTKTVQEDDLKMSRLKKEHDNILHEKNLVSAHLTKRNDEYTQLKDNLDALQAAYNRTEKQYMESIDDMRIMKIEIQNLRTERDVLKKDRECAADLRTDLLQMHRVLNQERIKAKALQEEMLTPMNIHRWRNLSGRDPEKMDLIKRIQLLRRQILSKNLQVYQRDEALKECKLLYTVLKEFMLKLPSYKIKEHLNEVKHNLSLKDRKLKALVAELHTKEIEEKVRESYVEELKSNYSSAKRELTEEKKKKMKLLEERQIMAEMQLHCFSAPPLSVRSMGAGFKMHGYQNGIGSNVNGVGGGDGGL